MPRLFSWFRPTSVCLILAIVAATSGARVPAHSCQILVVGNRGREMLTVRGHAPSPKVHYFGGNILSYGVAGDRLITMASVYPATPEFPHTIRFTVWDTHTQRILSVANSNTAKLLPPPPMEGFLEGMVVASRHTGYFQAWDLINHGKILSSSKNWLAKVDLKTGVASQNVRIPLPKGVAMLFKATAVQNGMVLFCPRCGVPTSAWWYTPTTRKLVRLPGVVPKRGGLIFVKNYGLLAWGPHGKLQRITRADMSRGDFPSLSIPRGVVNVHVVRHGSTPRLACLSWLNMAGQPTDRPNRSTLSMYDLKQHKILWRKVFKFPTSVLNTSFRVSANGRVFAFLNWWGKPQVVFYDHRGDRITTAKLPVSGVSLRYNGRVIAVK